MRTRVVGDVIVQAVSGTYVVLFGMNMAQADTTGLLGFAIQREELMPDGEVEWLRSSKAFPSLQSTTAFTRLRSVESPFQAFQWADYYVMLTCVARRYALFMTPDPRKRRTIWRPSSERRSQGSPSHEPTPRSCTTSSSF